jgi:alcohol dehydrogenase
MDALGHTDTCYNSVDNLRKRGKHLQVGLMVAEHSTPTVPMGKVIANELEILGCHGMQAHKYEPMIEMILNGKLQPKKLIGKIISLEESSFELTNMDNFSGTGIKVINKF